MRAQRWYTALTVSCLTHRGIGEDGDGRPWAKGLNSVSCVRVCVWDTAGRSINKGQIVELNNSTLPNHDGVHNLTEVEHRWLCRSRHCMCGPCLSMMSLPTLADYLLASGQCITAHT